MAGYAPAWRGGASCHSAAGTTSTRNVKNERTGKWEKQPYYTIDDKMPLGHGPKSAMIVKQYIELTTAEIRSRCRP